MGDLISSHFFRYYYKFKIETLNSFLVTSNYFNKIFIQLSILNFYLIICSYFQGYGIATPKGSPWRDKISLAILELQEKGEIQILYDKWWKNSDETCTRKSNSQSSKVNSLGLESIGMC